MLTSPKNVASLVQVACSSPEEELATLDSAGIVSVYDVRNVNLSQAQKQLKLDHDRLGHLSMQLIQKLHQPEDLSSPDFDGHPTSGLPCLVAKDSSQMRYTPPLCEACEIACARKRPTGATIKTANPDTIDGI